MHTHTLSLSLSLSLSLCLCLSLHLVDKSFGDDFIGIDFAHRRVKVTGLVLFLCARPAIPFPRRRRIKFSLYTSVFAAQCFGGHALQAVLSSLHYPCADIGDAPLLYAYRVQSSFEIA